MVTADWKSMAAIFGSIGISNQFKNRSKFVEPLLNIGWIEKLYPQKARHPNQKYKITESGTRILTLIGN